MLCSVLVLATATITQFDKLLLNNATFMYQRYYMYDQHFSGGKEWDERVAVNCSASSFIERLERMQPELNITKEEKLCICIAGLMHDVGHITQGHLYPLYVRYCNSKVLVEHEVMSIYIFQMILEKYDLMKEFAKYNLDKKVRVISPGHVVGSASHL